MTAAAYGPAIGNPGPAGWAWCVDDASWAIADAWINAAKDAKR